MKWLILSLLYLIQLHCISQTVSISDGEFQSEIYGNESEIEGKKRILQGAILNALEKAYGVAVFQGNNLYIHNSQIGANVESKTLFTMYGETYVKGELLEIISEKFTQITFENKKLKKNKKTENSIGIEWRCDVKIKCREYVQPSCNFNSITLNCPDTNTCKTTTFRNGESFFIQFKSPKSGFISIFLDDNHSSSILLPYVTNRQEFIGGFPVESNKSYIFFENNKEYFDSKKTEVDELEWYSKDNMEKLTIIFSPEALIIPDLNQNIIKYVPSNYNLPDNLKSEDFNKWLITLQSKRKDIEIMRIYLNTMY
jgi:hypothetical protein